MRNFLLGFIAAVILVGLAVFFYIRLGFVDPRADIPMGPLESKLAMPALDASVDKRAPDVKNPFDASDANLAAGMKVYQTNCAGCHGDIQQHRSPFGEALYPRAPQFVEDAPDMPENQNLYIVQHGVRLSGMPAEEKTLTDQQTWQVVTFLSHMDKLPPAVTDQWKALAAAAAAQQGSTSDSSASTDKQMNMQ